MESQEKDFLRYRSNKIPRVIRFAWTLFVLFATYYLITYFWPNLMEKV